MLYGLGLDSLIQVDGGISKDTIGLCLKAGGQRVRLRLQRIRPCQGI